MYTPGPLSFLAALIVNTLVSMVIGACWYSLKGFGTIWAKEAYGDIDTFEKHLISHKQNLKISMSITCLCHLFYNFFLIFLVNQVVAPHTLLDVVWIASMLVFAYTMFELPHATFENRSYVALVIHIAYHFVITLVPLTILKIFFRMPSSYVRF